MSVAAGAPRRVALGAWCDQTTLLHCASSACLLSSQVELTKSTNLFVAIKKSRSQSTHSTNMHHVSQRDSKPASCEHASAPPVVDDILGSISHAAGHKRLSCMRYGQMINSMRYTSFLTHASAFLFSSWKHSNCHGRSLECVPRG